MQFGLVGVEFGHGSLALVEEHNGATTSQRNAPPPLTAIIIRRGPLDPFE